MATSNDALEQQVAAERLAIENAPRIPVVTGSVGRCCLCGRVRDDLEPLEVLHGQERFTGGCCRPAEGWG